MLSWQTIRSSDVHPPCGDDEMMVEERLHQDEGEESPSLATDIERCRCFSELREEIGQLKQSLLELVIKKRTVIATMTRLVEGRRRVAMRQKAYHESKQKLQREIEELHRIVSGNQRKEDRLVRVRNRNFSDKLSYMERDCRERWREVEEKRESLQEMRRKKVVAVHTSVFPIQVDPLSVDDAGDEDYQQSAGIDVEAIMDIDDGWILSGVHRSPSPHASVITASLPLNGDYSTYIQAADERRKKLRDATESGAPLPPVTTPGLHPLLQPYLAIPAGLQFTAQLVEIVADILNIPLPHPLHIPLSILEYGDQNKKKKSFYESLAKLDDNIVYLCFSQNVPLSALSVGHTLSNLLALVTHSELGRQGAFLCQPELATYTGGGGGGAGAGDAENEPPSLCTADLPTAAAAGGGGGVKEDEDEDNGGMVRYEEEDDDWSRVEVRGQERRPPGYDLDYMTLGVSTREEQVSQGGGGGGGGGARLLATISTIGTSLFGSTFTSRTTTS